jgi:hypothetical protein
MRWEKSYGKKVKFLFPTEKTTLKMFLETESYACRGGGGESEKTKTNKQRTQNALSKYSSSASTVYSYICSVRIYSTL